MIKSQNNRLLGLPDAALERIIEFSSDKDALTLQLSNKQLFDRLQRLYGRKLFLLRIIPRELFKHQVFKDNPINFVKLYQTAVLYQHYISTQVNEYWQLACIAGQYSSLTTLFPLPNKPNVETDPIRQLRDSFNWGVLQYAGMSASTDFMNNLKKTHLYRLPRTDARGYSPTEWNQILLLASMRHECGWGEQLLETACSYGKTANNIRQICDRANRTYDHYAATTGRSIFYIPHQTTIFDQYNQQAKDSAEYTAKTYQSNGDTNVANAYQERADYLKVTQLTTITPRARLTDYQILEPYHLAAQAGQTHLLYLFLSQDINLLFYKDQNGWTMMHHAACYGQYESINYLLIVFKTYLRSKNVPTHKIPALQDLFFCEPNKNGYTPIDILLNSIKVIPDNYAVTLRQIQLSRKLNLYHSVNFKQSKIWASLPQYTKNVIENIIALREIKLNSFNWQLNDGRQQFSPARSVIECLKGYIKTNRSHNNLVNDVTCDLEQYFMNASRKELVEYLDKLIDEVIVANTTRMMGSYAGEFLQRIYFCINQLNVEMQHGRSPKKSPQNQSSSQFFHRQTVQNSPQRRRGGITSSKSTGNNPNTYQQPQQESYYKP